MTTLRCVRINISSVGKQLAPLDTRHVGRQGRWTTHVFISAWHESYGEQTQEVTITGSETRTINFVFKAKPY